MERNITRCRWSTPTLFLQWPYWLDAWTWPWTCSYEGQPTLTSGSELCRNCTHWEMRPAGALPPEFHDVTIKRG